MRITSKHLKEHSLPIILTLLGVALRLVFVRDSLGEWDEVDFALAMRDYDVVADQPHFPGYPVFIWLCYLARTVTHDDIRALTLTSAISGGLATLPLYYLTRDMCSQRTAALTAGLFVVNPLCWLQSERAMSDTTGLFFLLLSLFILHRAYIAPDTAGVTLPAGAALFGITLGVRLSYLPFLFFLGYVAVHALVGTASKKDCLYVTSGTFILGTLVWLAPLATNVAGAKGLSSLAVAFAGGHFADWGGSIITAPDPFYRLKQVLHCLFCHGLGLRLQASLCVGITAAIFAAGVIISLRNALRGAKVGLVFALILPYMLWVFFVQNVEKPRHVLPLIPFVLMLISAGVLSMSRSRGLVVALGMLAVLTSGITSLRSVNVQATTMPPTLQMVRYVTGNFDKLSTRIYCGQSKRLFEYYAPGWDARMARDIGELRYDLSASICPPTVILVTSEVRGAFEMGSTVRRFVEDRHVFAPYHELILYKLGRENCRNPCCIR